MAVKIRLARGGTKKRPFFRIVAADERSPRDGRYIERLGTYNPLLSRDSAERVVMDVERVKDWGRPRSYSADKRRVGRPGARREDDRAGGGEGNRHEEKASFHLRGNHLV